MKKIISVMMLLVMVFSLFTIGHATPEIGSMAIEPEQTGEVLELREKNSETYRLEDGSYECVVFAEDKYFEDETGKLVEISNTVVPEKHTIAGKEYGFTNEANSTRIYFSENEPSILVSTGEQDIAFSTVTDRAVTPVIGGLKDVGEIAEYSLSGDTCFAYMNAFEHTDLVYKVRNGMLKEYIVLNDASAPREFTFTFGTEGYTVAYTEYGTVGFYDGEGELVFELGNLFAVDSADAYTDELTYSIGETIEGKTEITVTLSEDYAADPERAYPILVDPSVVVYGTYETQDSFVSSLNPTTNYYSKKYIRMGWDSNYNIRRTYIRFNLPSFIPYEAITESYMSLKKYDCGSDPSLNAYRVTSSWTSNAITWDNKPGYTSTNASATAEERTNNWYRFYVADIVKEWYAGTYQNYGFMVKNSIESGTGNWSTFYSSDADSPNKPELRITFRAASFTMHSYLDIGFQARFSNSVQNVNTYHETVSSILEEIFPVNVAYYVHTFTSFCDKCKNQTYGVGNWGSGNLTGTCSHAQEHLSVNPGYNQMDKSKGFYFDFVNNVGVGTPTLTRYFWTGHIPEPTNQASFSVQYYHDAYIPETIHSIVCIMPGVVTQGTGFTNKPQNKVDQEYEYTLLHETSHQLGAPDHYCRSSNGQPCSNAYCWECHPELVSDSCVMYCRYNLDNLDESAMYCPQCIETIKAHLCDHHY